MGGWNADRQIFLQEWDIYIMAALCLMREDCQLTGLGVKVLADGRHAFYGGCYGHVRI